MGQVGINPHLPVDTIKNNYEKKADPGAGGALPADGGFVPIVSAGAEARSLAAPTHIGARLHIFFQTDGGNVTITSAVAINRAGNTVMTLANAGESAILEAVDDGAGAPIWRITHNDMATALA